MENNQGMFYRWSLVPQSIRHKLMVSFALMSIIPLLICGYILSIYIFPACSDIRQVSMIMLISISISLLGLYIAKEIVDAIIILSRRVKNISEGEFSEVITGPVDDEIGQLCTSIKDLVEHINLTSIKDKLTSLYNKNYLTERLADDVRMAVSLQKPCAFVALTLSDYAAIKTKASVHELHQLIVKIAHILQKNVPESGRVIRMEEEQFAVILFECDKHAAQDIAEKIRQLMENAGVNISGGISEVPLDGVTAEAVLGKAITLMQRAKEQGNSRILI